MKTKTIASFDPWLKPYLPQLKKQQSYYASYNQRLLGDGPLEDFALGFDYFGLHRQRDAWVFREWAPGAISIYFLCEANDWQPHADFQLVSLPGGKWELKLPLKTLKHGDHYKLRVYWRGGQGDRLPAYTTYAVQDPDTHSFDAVVWQPEEFWWQHKAPARPKTPLIYEAHVGMSSERPEVASYDYFRAEVLPRIKKLGYNTVQIMAVQEHPYYASFGYHVSNFFAASSRFGTPEDLKRLIDEAHGLGLYVIMDIVHSHAVKNEAEGLSRLDGSYTQYFHDGERGNHQAWDSRTFDYGKPEVAHFLLSNVRYWLKEFRFDGFRFDGVTSMLYLDHGLGRAFGSYDDYFSENLDLDAAAYLRLATQLARKINPKSLLIAEDTSAFPGLAAPLELGGLGFDYRLSMGVPDLWIKTLKEKRDEDWDLGHLFHELTAKRPEEAVISYSESHDQALVGDKTLIFRLIDKAMYSHMRANDPDLTVERGMALHKIIRLLTASTNGGGYLNFMGNEFGHPEWIDFPRQGNDWSYHYARRQWSLADSPNLKYKYLQVFDSAMISLVKNLPPSIDFQSVDNKQRLISFMRGDYLFVFNLSPTKSYEGYKINCRNGEYQLVLSSDDTQFGGQDRVQPGSYPASQEAVKLYLPSRTALVFKRQ